MTGEGRADMGEDYDAKRSNAANDPAESAGPYEPVDCTMHDQLVERAAFRLPTKVTYRNERGELVVAQDLIQDVFSREGAEYVRLASGTEIRLDQIVDFGGIGSTDPSYGDR